MSVTRTRMICEKKDNKNTWFNFEFVFCIPADGPGSQEIHLREAIAPFPHGRVTSPYEPICQWCSVPMLDAKSHVLLGPINDRSAQEHRELSWPFPHPCDHTTNDNQTRHNNCLTVRFLVSGSGTWTSELLGFRPSVVGNEKCAVVLDKGLLQLVLCELIDEFLVVGNDSFGDRLTDGIDLRSVTTTGNPNADVDLREFVKTNNQEGLVDLDKMTVCEP